MALHEPWVTSSARHVLQVIEAYGGQTFLDEEGLIVVEVDEEKMEETNLELARHGCKLSSELLHTI